MSCMFCRHWRDPKDHSSHSRAEAHEQWKAAVAEGRYVDYMEGAVGHCTFFPKWEQTTGGHYCDNLHMKDPSSPGSWWRRMQLSEDRELRVEIRRLKKVAKDLRVKLRAAASIARSDQ